MSSRSIWMPSDTVHIWYLYSDLSSFQDSHLYQILWQNWIISPCRSYIFHIKNKTSLIFYLFSFFDCQLFWKSKSLDSCQQHDFLFAPASECYRYHLVQPLIIIKNSLYSLFSCFLLILLLLTWVFDSWKSILLPS